jgi:Neuraminidase (sialidase)
MLSLGLYSYRNDDDNEKTTTLDSKAVLGIVHRTRVIQSNTINYQSFRIPVIEVAPNGDLLVFCEARVSQDDYGDIDLMMFRSKDRGKTWSSGIVVIENGSNTVAEPVVILDQNLDRLHLLYQKRPGNNSFDDYLRGMTDNSQGYYSYSDDSGQTWSISVDITNQILPEGDKVLPMFGPNRGIILKSGRLLVPMYYADQATGEFQPAPIYSDDKGETWQRSDDWGPPGSNETTLIQATNGDVLVIARNDSKGNNNRKVYAVSKNGGVTWDMEGEVDPYVFEGSCQQSMTVKEDHIYFSGPAKKSRNFWRHRRDGRVKIGLYDPNVAGHINWLPQEELQITSEGFAYSSITRSGNKLHLVYESTNPDDRRSNYLAIEYVQIEIRQRSNL